MLWVQRYDGPDFVQYWDRDEAVAIAVDDACNVYVAGYVRTELQRQDYAVIKYDTDGKMLWVKTYDCKGWDDRVFDMAVDEAGNVYVTGRSGNYTATMKYDTNGNLQWVAQLGSPRFQQIRGEAIAVDKDGNVYVAATLWAGINRFDYATFKYDSSGQELWAAFYNGASSEYDYITDIAVGPSGALYVTGRTSELHDQDVFTTIKYEPNGSQAWVAHHPGYTEDYPCRGGYLAIDGMENIYVAGSKYWHGETSFDWNVVKYDKDGNELWVGRHHWTGQSWDEAYAIAVDGGGDIYVTGRAYGGMTENYIETVKYSLPVLECAVDIDPDTVNLKNRGTWITVYIELPEGYDVNDIDVSTVFLEGTVPAATHPASIGDNDIDGILDLMVKFEREAVVALLSVGENVELKITGDLVDGPSFHGVDIIRVISKGK